jgi:hypothetical protein
MYLKNIGQGDVISIKMTRFETQTDMFIMLCYSTVCCSVANTCMQSSPLFHAASSLVPQLVASGLVFV